MSSRPAWYERLGARPVKTIEGEDGFRYEIAVRKDETSGAVYIFVAKVVPSGTFAKSILRIPLGLARRIAEAVIEAANEAK